MMLSVRSSTMCRHLDLTVQCKYLIVVINTALTDERFIVTNPYTQLREQNRFISHHSMQSLNSD